MVQVRTEKLGELPLVDFYPVDYGQQQQAFGFEVRLMVMMTDIILKYLIFIPFSFIGGSGLLQVTGRNHLHHFTNI